VSSPGEGYAGKFAETLHPRIARGFGQLERPKYNATMRGFVETPDQLVDLMVNRLFDDRPPVASDRLLDPGCGKGAFILGVLRWCKTEGVCAPAIDGIELDPEKLGAARSALNGHEAVRLVERDFLRDSETKYDYVIGNPPYVSISHLSEDEKRTYRSAYRTARRRFDLYFLFFEQAIRQLKPGGRMVFVTPEKFLYVESARELRKLLATLDVVEIELVAEDAFGGLVTYPAVTSLVKRRTSQQTRFVNREGELRELRFTRSGDPLLHQMNGGGEEQKAGPTLDEACQRISAGVATGADAIFVKPSTSLNRGLGVNAYPTVSGRQLSNAGDELRTTDALLIPYDEAGCLRPLEDLGALGDYLSQEQVRSRLLSRTCVKRKPWYAFHETPPMKDILQPKILCKDISPAPRFWLDTQGSIVPRHTVYYLVPKPGVDIHQLAEHLSSDQSHEWLLRNCQRAANGFVRLQSSVLKRLPIPVELAQQRAELDLWRVRDSAPVFHERGGTAVLIGVA